MFEYEYDIFAVPTAFGDRDTQEEFLDLFEISEQEENFKDTAFSTVLNSMRMGPQELVFHQSSYLTLVNSLEYV